MDAKTGKFKFDIYNKYKNLNSIKEIENELNSRTSPNVKYALNEKDGDSYLKLIIKKFYRFLFFKIPKRKEYYVHFLGLLPNQNHSPIRISERKSQFTHDYAISYYTKYCISRLQHYIEGGGTFDEVGFANRMDYVIICGYDEGDLPLD